jgi:hypothetical protein
LSSEYQDEVLRRDNGVWKDCGSQCCCEPLWSVYAGTVFLRRDNPDVAAPFGFDALGFDALGFDVGVRAGVDIDIRRRLGERHELQVRSHGGSRTPLVTYGSATGRCHFCGNRQELVTSKYGIGMPSMISWIEEGCPHSRRRAEEA